MQRWARILKHRWHDETDVGRALSRAALRRLETRVAASEQRHSGEIRVCVEAGLPLRALWQHHSARRRAVALFGELRVWDTEHNNGALIYLLLAERAIEIVVDRGLARHVPQSHWDAVVASLRAPLQAGQFEAGLMRAIEDVEQVLAREFGLAAGADNPDELPNRVELR